MVVVAAGAGRRATVVPAPAERRPPPAVRRAYIGLGANLGDARATVRAALAALAAQPGLRLRAVSPLYRSAALPAGGPDYLNAVAALDSQLSPDALLQRLQTLEAAHGRERPYANAPRTLDLDLLLHGRQRRSSPALTLPHPRLHQRAFVLRPLLDLAPRIRVQGLGPLQAWWPAASAQRIERVAGADWAA